MAKYLLKPLERAINAYISLDDDYSRLLRPLAGKVVVVEVRGVDIKLNMKFYSEHVELLESFYGIADAYLAGTPISLFLLNKSENTARDLFSSDVEVRGNTEVAQQFGDLFQHLDIDWEEHFSRIVGDPVAHSVGNFVRSIVSWSQQSFATVKQNFSEYIQEEIRHLPPRKEIDDFLDNIDQIRCDVDRMQVRIERLKKSKE